MTAIYLATGAVAVAGMVAALAFVTVQYMSLYPAPFELTESDWPFDGVDLLWWDEPIR